MYSWKWCTMKGTAVELFSWEIIQSYRSTCERIKEHPFMTAWFLILLFGGFWMTLRLIEFAATLEDPLLQPTRGDVLFALFIVIMSKASVETVENTLRNQELKHIFTSPVDMKDISLARFLKVFWYNLLLVALAMFIVTVVIYGFGISLPIGPYFFPHLYILLVIAPLIGFNMAILSHIDSLWKKILLLVLYGQNITLIWKALQAGLEPLHLSLFLSLIGVASFLVLLCSVQLFFKSWKRGIITSTDISFHFHDAGDFLPKVVPETIRRVAEKDFLTRWRRRQIPASLGVTGLISGGLLFFFYQLGPDPELGLEMGAFIYPMLIAISLYLAIVLQIVLPLLSVYGREGENMWALKILPSSPDQIAWGKTLSLLLFSPLIPLLISLPLPILLGYSMSKVLFIFIAGIVMIFSLSGIGIWAGARFPNFDGGSPDIITMYTVLIICLIFSAAYLSVPMTIYLRDEFLGILGLILAGDLAALQLVLLVGRSGKLFEEMEMSM